MSRPSLQMFARSASESRHPRLWNGLVSAWAPCLGPTGANLRDRTGRHNHGSLTNMTVDTAWQVSAGRYALGVDGTNDFVVVLDADSLDVASLTISGWMLLRSAPVSTNAVLAAKGSLIGDSTSTWALYTNQALGVYRFFCMASDGSIGIVSGSSYVLGLWAHVAGVFDGSTVSIYVNGKFIASAAFVKTLRVSTHALRFGGDGSSFFGDSLLDDIRMYGRALTPSEIYTLSLRRGIAYERREVLRAPVQAAASSVPVFYHHLQTQGIA